jgi:hypothetical protein
LQVQKDAFEEWFRPTLMEAGYEGIFQPPPRRPVVGWYPKKKLTGALYVGNRWVAGSCWDEKNDSSCLWIIPENSLLSTSKKKVRDPPLVGGLEHEFYDFPFSWECHHPN